MHISKFQLTNYKCFASTSILKLTPGFNLITGPNNVGKTALLEGLTLSFRGKPHRSLKSLPTPKSPISPLSIAHFSLTLSNAELRTLLIIPGRRYSIPLPDVRSDIAKGMGFTNDSEPSMRKNVIEWLLAQESYTFRYKLVAGEDGQSDLTVGVFPTLEAFDAITVGEHGLCMPVEVDSENRFIPDAPVRSNVNQDFGLVLGRELLGRIYCFRAQRTGRAACSVGQSRMLKNDAANLAEVLNVLQSNPHRFERYNEIVRAIVPQVRAITVRPVVDNNVEILVWNHDPGTQREDLAFSLDESGTGIGQLLAILYVIFTSQESQVILIDEPQTFLHRGAARKLMEVLKRYPQHQYIIATHSPTVITATKPSTFTLIRQQDGVSTVELLNATEVEHQRLCLLELGATPADVFGYDNVLCVEGETEETCFPKIHEQLNHGSLMGTAIKRVKHTGDFEKRDANIVFDVYKRLSHGGSLLPAALAFIFDDECRTDSEKKEMRTQSSAKAVFLPRRMYENYLLNSKAIAAVMNETIQKHSQDYNGSPVSEEEVSDFLLKAKTDERYFEKAEDAIGREDWKSRIHAGKVLSDCFSELSKTKAPLTFDKLKHSIALTDWLIEHEPGELGELASFLSEILSPIDTMRGSNKQPQRV